MAQWKSLCSTLLFLFSLFVSGGLCARLAASHYSGTVSTLSLEGNSLKETSSLRACGALPAWLTYDSTSQTVYCSDENFMFGSGSLSALQQHDASLSAGIKVNAPQGGVANVLYGGTNSSGYVAVAHYQVSQITTFKLPLTASSTPQQTLTFTMSRPGPNPYRQDRPHPHEVLIDPTGNFLLAPDLGADIVRVYSIDRSNGQLKECSGLNTAPGAGPRHAAFWTPNAASSRVRRGPQGTMLYVLNELANNIVAYSVRYPTAGCLSFVQTQALNPYPNNKPAPTGAKAGEIRIKDNFLYTSNRNDKSFSGNDSIATWSIANNGAIAFQNLTSSYGTYPRTFSINKAGDLIAIGDQTTANVAIVRRDTVTGALGQLFANLRIGAAGTPENEDGLSSVVWTE